MRHDLGDQRSEDEMPCCEDDGLISLAGLKGERINTLTVIWAMLATFAFKGETRTETKKELDIRNSVELITHLLNKMVRFDQNTHDLQAAN